MTASNPRVVRALSHSSGRLGRLRWGGLAGAVVASTLLLGAGACSSGVASGSDTSGPASAAPAPTGAPIVLGITNQEAGAIGTLPELREAAEAAVKYVNTELGG